ncbi:MAG TPA: Cof-type HAD-IIB family hydrolase [Virgibacillus sp.]|nr:Cof-type HAD-IIB family hydrolase [Virgibacillus sp.]HLR68127.1 Cof-type HAD-IIB family hydrolase [Virgibacillus sp.]
MTRLIAIDMDGTLLSRDHTIRIRNKEAILQAKANGIEVIIATGRNFPEAYQIVTEQRLNPPFICLNGAEVRDESGKIISATYLMEDDLKQMLPILQAAGLEYELFIDQYIYTRDLERQIDMFLLIAGAEKGTPAADKIRSEVLKRAEQGFIRTVPSYDEVFQKHHNEISKVLAASFHDEKLRKAKEKLQEFPGLAVSSSGPGNIEINHVNAQKGVALEQYAKSKGISMEDVMVIGDNYNDISMMKRAGRAVAMGNAVDEIKAYCSHVTATNEEDGVALAIEAVL